MFYLIPDFNMNASTLSLQSRMLMVKDEYFFIMLRKHLFIPGFLKIPLSWILSLPCAYL